GISGPVETSVAHRRLASAILHDVDLAALRPADRRIVVAEKPERRPQTDSGGELHPRFEPAIRLREMALGLHARRGVTLSLVRFVEARNDEGAVPIDVRVLRAIAVVLELAISPAGPSRFESPLRAIDARLGGPVELVVPRERPARLRGIVPR